MDILEGKVSFNDLILKEDEDVENKFTGSKSNDIKMKVFIGVDVGGTFTDFVVRLSNSNQQVLYKVPSKPSQPDLAIVDGLREIMSTYELKASDIVRFAHGTTVGTNALIQRKVGKVALITTEGFRDLLEIGRQVRPKVYDIHQDFPKPLVPRWLRYEVPERMRADGVVHTPLDEDRILRVGQEMSEEGVDCVAVCFLHSHARYSAKKLFAEHTLCRKLLQN